MLADFTPSPTIAVTDMARAREFYEGVLGFTVDREMPEGVIFRAGTGGFLVYSSSFAGTNKATYMSFDVPAGSFDDIVAKLREKGVSFQTFDTPVGTWNDGVLDFGEGSRGVWFEDPDGNILNVDVMAD